MRTLKLVPARRVQFGGEFHKGWLPVGAAVPPPTPVETVTLEFRILAEGDTGYVFEWRGPTRYWSGDTWHFSLADALADAEQRFGIEADEWHDVQVT